MKIKAIKIEALMQAISLIENHKEAENFFTDLCTPAELEAMADRWLIVPLIQEGLPYRRIHEKTGVSLATITRVARCIKMGAGGYTMMLKRIRDKHS